MAVRIAMNGKELGEFQESEIPRLLSEKVLDHTGHFWREGMLEWRPVEELFSELLALKTAAKVARPPSDKPKTPRAKKALTKAHTQFFSKRGIPYEGLTREQADALMAETKADERLDAERQRLKSQAELAEYTRQQSLPTPRQLAYLDYHCVSYPPAISKSEAGRLIDEAIAKYPESDWNRVKHLIRPDLYDFNEGEAPLLKQIEDVQSQIAALKSLASPSREDLDEAHEMLQEAMQELRDYESEFDGSVDWWHEKFTEDEYMPMEDAVRRFLEVFKKPSKTQIHAVLKRFEQHYRLSVGSVTIDEFFLVYSKLYPDCFKKGRTASFNVEDITIEPYYGKARSERNQPQSKYATAANSETPQSSQAVTPPVRLTSSGKIFLVVVGALVVLFILVSLSR